MSLFREYPQLTFREDWELGRNMLIMLGQCEAYIRAINNTPIMPDFYQELMTLALRKGAQATTAIEGNTLTDEEIAKLQRGEKLPPSKEYQQIEVNNILEAFNTLLQETVYEKKEQFISKELLLRLHRMVGQGLGEHFSAIPGQFRNSDVIVGPYRAPDYRDVEPLMEQYCGWLKSQFRYERGDQHFSEVMIQAIVAHVYLEWIHPFGDGNGRTGRLVEFYILSRGGNPDISLHVLSNHYNNTRPEYYRQLEKATTTRSLTAFIEYALTGFRDGLQQILEKIQSSQILITWHKYVYDKFGEIEMKQKDVFKRRRSLGLEVPIDRKFSFEEIPELTIKLARLYSGISSKTLERDIDELLKNDILLYAEGKYYANILALNKMIAKWKGL